MDDEGVRTFVNEIVMMPDADRARALALSNRKLLVSPAAYRIIHEQLSEIGTSTGGSNWVAALTSLGEFRAELLSRMTTGRDLNHPPLPPLSVAPDPARDRFAYWLDRIEGERSPNDLPPPSGTGAAQVALRVLQLEQRHLALLPRTMFGKADAAVIEDLQAILTGYHELLEAGIPESPLVTVEGVLGRCAQVHESLGRVWDVLGDHGVARVSYERAVALHDQAGDTQSAEAARDRMARVQLDAEGDIDVEILRLQEAIDTTASGSSRHAQLLVELAELYQRGGNDFDAAPLLQQAQEALRGMGYDDPAGPTGRELADRLADFARGAGALDLATRAARLQEVVLVRNLFERIYLAWVQVYQGRGDAKAAKRYQALAASLEDEAINAEFSRAMTAALPELFRADNGAVDREFSRNARSLMTAMDHLFSDL